MIVVGIDEVGRGCWAGPLVAGAVLLKQPLEGLRDSKKLTKLQREQLAESITASGAAIGIGWVDAATIDKVGITTAVKMAMEAALKQIEEPYDRVIIDGHINFLNGHPKTEAIIKADDSVPAVSAASIVAKVARDRYMAEQALLFPEYGFDTHVGYGTALHLEQLRLHGVTPLHRRSYKPIQALVQ